MMPPPDWCSVPVTVPEGNVVVPLMTVPLCVNVPITSCPGATRSATRPARTFCSVSESTGNALAPIALYHCCCTSSDERSTVENLPPVTTRSVAFDELFAVFGSAGFPAAGTAGIVIGGAPSAFADSLYWHTAVPFAGTATFVTAPTAVAPNVLGALIEQSTALDVVEEF